MLADFLTKPLQGSLFRKLRDVLLGYKHFNTLLEDLELSPSKEHVGKRNIGANIDWNQEFEEESNEDKIQDVNLVSGCGKGQRANKEVQQTNQATYAEVLKRNTTENK